MSNREIIPIPNAHKVAAPLAHAVRIGDILYVSGVPGYFGDRELAVNDFEAQCEQALDNLHTILTEAGSSFDKIVKTNVILTRQSDFAAMNDIYKKRFSAGNFPARTTIIADLARPEMLLEIEVVAAL